MTRSLSLELTTRNPWFAEKVGTVEFSQSWGYCKYGMYIYICIFNLIYIYIYINRKRRGISLNKGCSFFQVWQRNWSHPQAEQCQRSSQSLGIPNKKHLLGMAIILNPTDVSYWILDTPSPTDGYYYNPTVIIRVFLLQLSIILLLSYINLHSMMKYPTMYHCYWGYHIIYTHV